MCFVHVLLNAMDLHEKGHEVALVIEGSATALVGAIPGGSGLPDSTAAPEPVRRLIVESFARVHELGLIDCVCRACCKQMGTLEEAEQRGLPLCASLKGHPSMADYIGRGFDVITF